MGFGEAGAGGEPCWEGGGGGETQYVKLLASTAFRPIKWSTWWPLKFVGRTTTVTQSVTNRNSSTPGTSLAPEERLDVQAEELASSQSAATGHTEREDAYVHGRIIPSRRDDVGLRAAVGGRQPAHEVAWQCFWPLVLSGLEVPAPGPNHARVSSRHARPEAGPLAACRGRARSRLLRHTAWAPGSAG